MLSGMTTLFHKLQAAFWPHRCNVCQSRVARFQALDSHYIDLPRKYDSVYGPDDVETLNYRNYYCPHCGATDRDRLYCLYVHSLAKRGTRLAEQAMLDIAPSRLRMAICHLFKEYRTCDLFAEKVDDRVDLMKMDLYPDARWDAFICSHVLEHVPDDRRALSELFRVLKPGGWGILMVPINVRMTQIDENPAVTDVGERWRRFGQDDHVRAYDKQGFLGRVREAGFEVNEYGAKYFGRFAFWRYGITQKSVLYVVEKRHDENEPHWN